VKNTSANHHHPLSNEPSGFTSKIFLLSYQNGVFEIWEGGAFRYAKQANRLGVYLFCFNLPFDPQKQNGRPRLFDLLFCCLSIQGWAKFRRRVFESALDDVHELRAGFGWLVDYY
jgi:hypothetical protein